MGIYMLLPYFITSMIYDQFLFPNYACHFKSAYLIIIVVLKIKIKHLS